MAINNKDLREVGAHAVSAADELARVLKPTTALDWEQLTPDLAWTQSQTAIHTMRACLEYSYQVVGKKLDTYQPVLFEKKEAATPADYLLMIPTAARVLSRVVATAEPEDRAWHAYGESDPIGFAAMGVVVVRVHTYDLGKGFGIEFTPLEAPSEFAITRLFADTVETSADFASESWGKKLLWYAGRIELAGMPRREGWKWNGRVR